MNIKTVTELTNIIKTGVNYAKTNDISMLHSTQCCFTYNRFDFVEIIRSRIVQHDFNVKVTVRTFYEPQFSSLQSNEMTDRMQLTERNATWPSVALLVNFLQSPLFTNFFKPFIGSKFSSVRVQFQKPYTNTVIKPIVYNIEILHDCCRDHHNTQHIGCISALGGNTESLQQKFCGPTLSRNL